jgi:hypothetical protein
MPPVRHVLVEALRSPVNVNGVSAIGCGMLRDSANQRSPNVIADIERPHLLAFPSNLHPFTRIILDPLLGDARVVSIHFLNHSLKMLRLDNKSGGSKVNIDR